jgi:hypothetical protein
MVEKNCMCVSDVGNPCHICVPLKNTKELPLQRNAMCASNVEKPSVLPVT